MTSGNVIVVIPVYQVKFTVSEERSIANTIAKFGSEMCCFVSPASWNNEILNSIAKAPDCSIKRFNDSFFKGIEGYNRLLLMSSFYKAFSKYKFMLICQPDAWVFKNELEIWTKKGFDYYGAPIILNQDPLKPEFLAFGGNGGFSLRNIRAHLLILSKFKIMDSPSKVVSYYKRFHKGFALFLRVPLIVAGFLGYKNNSKYIIKKFGTNEDMFWSKIAKDIDSEFKPAPAFLEVAFAFERDPSVLYKMNDHKLPFGCHAWEKYEPEFWKDHIG